MSQLALVVAGIAEYLDPGHDVQITTSPSAEPEDDELRRVRGELRMVSAALDDLAIRHEITFPVEASPYQKVVIVTSWITTQSIEHHKRQAKANATDLARVRTELGAALGIEGLALHNKGLFEPVDVATASILRSLGASPRTPEEE